MYYAYIQGQLLTWSWFCLLPNGILHYTEEKGFHANSEDGHSQMTPNIPSSPTPRYGKNSIVQSSDQLNLVWFSELCVHR